MLIVVTRHFFWITSNKNYICIIQYNLLHCITTSKDKDDASEISSNVVDTMKCKKLRGNKKVTHFALYSVFDITFGTSPDLGMSLTE